MKNDFIRRQFCKMEKITKIFGEFAGMKIEVKYINKNLV